MKYLVMECGLSYSVVLDSEGRYLKVPNLGYETGQVLRQVVLFETPPVERAASAPLFRWVASAACLLFVLLGGWGFWQMPVGRIRMQINPDIVMVVNSFDRVLYLTGLNKEGDALIEAYSSYAKPYEKVKKKLNS